MRRVIFAMLATGLLMGAAFSAEAPRFDTPEALLETVYGQIEAEWDPDTHFDERETFSAKLSAQLEAANEEQYAEGNEIGALDFSPFIDGQDSGGMEFDIGTPAVDGDRATADVRILNFGDWVLHFDLVNEKKGGWKVDDITAERDGEQTWRLTELLAEPY